MTDTARPADTATTTSVRSVANVAGKWTVVWTARPWTTEELAARAAAAAAQARRQTIIDSITWLDTRAAAYETFGPVNSVNAVAALEALRQDLIIYFRGHADLIRTVLPT